MTTIVSSIGASLAYNQTPRQILPWKKIAKQVFQLQMCIAKATRARKTSKVKALQRILTCSFYGKCLAIKRVSSNRGSKTPGIDGKVWKTNTQKMQAVSKLRRNGYKPLPLKRIYIPKKLKGKLRPLSIPCQIDRAIQTLWQLALQPIAEEWADQNAYGFRLKRSAQDAIGKCFKALGKKSSATLVLEGDIHSCFDKISTKWLLDNIPMDKVILKKFIKAGYMENGKLYPTIEGTAQGGPISPTLSLMALSGLEQKLRSSCKRVRDKEKINYIAYADDFIVTAASEKLSKERVIPIITEFLKEIGLELSREKTKITDINRGFDFLGMNIRKYSNGKLIIKPAKANIKAFLGDIRKTIKANYALNTDKLIYLLNEKITGWTNYYRSVVSSKTFVYVDDRIYQALRLWSQRRHTNKSRSWIVRKYYTKNGLQNWRFYSIVKDKEGKKKPLYLRQAAKTTIIRHTKILAKANPFNPEFKDYFKNRRESRELADTL